MRISILALTAGALTLSTAAVAHDGAGLNTGKSPHQRGCSVQQVHTPAGKTVQSAPIVRCPAEKAIAKADPAPTAPGTARN